MPPEQRGQLTLGRAFAAYGRMVRDPRALGLLGANCVGLLMQRFDGNAGAAAALFGAGQFGFGMAASAAVSFFHDGSARPMAATIAVASTLSLAGTLLLRRGPAPRGGRR